MIIIGADYHPGFQQIAFVDSATGGFQERPLQQREEAEKFYRELAAQGMKVRVAALQQERNGALRSARITMLKKYLTTPALLERP